MNHIELLTCAYFDSFRCRSCSLLGSPAGSRLNHKNELFLREFNSFSRQGANLLPLWVPEPIFPSRSKAKLSVSGTVEAPVIGLLDRRFQGIELLSCPLHLPAINKIVASLPDFIRAARLPPYQIPARQGELKGVILKANQEQTEVIVRFVLRSTESVPRIRKGLPELLQTHKVIKVVSVNIQPVPHQIPEGAVEEIITEQQHIWEAYSDFQICYGPQCFSQVSSQCAAALYQRARLHFQELRPNLLLDLYCGVGGFSIHAAKYCGRVVGVESSAPAVRCATSAAERNGLGNVKFVAADVDAFLAAQPSEPAHTVLCNPPRRGLSQNCLEWLETKRPHHLVYSSCNPASLIRDLKRLQPCYDVAELAPFDMFPLTQHMEILALLHRRGG